MQRILDCSVLASLKRNAIYVSWGEFLHQLFGLAVQEFPYGKKSKPSIGQKLLPQRYKESGPAIVLANCLIWFSVLVLIVGLVYMLS